MEGGKQFPTVCNLIDNSVLQEVVVIEKVDVEEEVYVLTN